MPAEQVEPAEVPEASVPLNCDGRVTELEARQATVPEDLPLLVAPPGVRVPQGQGERIRRPRSVVTIGQEGILLFNGQVMEATQLQGRLDQGRRNWLLLHPQDPYPAIFYAWVDEGVKVQEARRVLRSNHHWLLVIQDPQQHADMPTCPPSIGDLSRFGSVSTSAAIDFAQAMTDAMGSCTELVHVFTRVAGIERADKSAFFRRELPGVLRQCECRVDFDAVEYLAMKLLGAGIPTYYTVQWVKRQAPDRPLVSMSRRSNCRLTRSRKSQSSRA